MLKPVAFASSLAIVGVIFYVGCAILVSTAPSLYFTILQSWFHGLDLSVAKPDGPLFDGGRFFIGLVTFALFLWISGAIVAMLNNRLAANKQT